MGLGSIVKEILARRSLTLAEPINLEDGLADSCPEIPEQPSEHDPGINPDDFLKSIQRAVDAVVKHDIHILETYPGRFHVDYYEKAWREALKGRDPSNALKKLHNPNRDVEPYLAERVSYQDMMNNPLMAEFVNGVFSYILSIVGDRYGKDFSELRAFAQGLPQQYKTELSEIVGNAFGEFALKRSWEDSQTEERIKRTYDCRRTEHNILVLIKKARISARAGNVKKTEARLEQIDYNSLGNWTRNIDEIRKQANRTVFRHEMAKADRALTLKRVNSAIGYLSKAEEYAANAGIQFKLSDPATIKDYVTQKNYDFYLDQFNRTYQGIRLISVLEQIHANKS
ncbi:MAG: hypothetical protein V1740_03900 [Candidatus Woesearchaeota archaeon]